MDRFIPLESDDDYDEIMDAAPILVLEIPFDANRKEPRNELLKNRICPERWKETEVMVLHVIHPTTIQASYFVVKQKKQRASACLRSKGRRVIF